MGPTLSKLSEETSFKFSVFGDTHYCRVSLREILRKAKSQGSSFAIHLGDFVEFDDDFEYRYFLQRTQDLTKNFPLLLVRGNHETMAPTGGFTHNFLKYVKSAEYSFCYGGCLFLILDDSSGELGKKQLKRCQKIVKDFREDYPNKPIFIFLHIPPQLPGLNNIYDLWESDSISLLKLATQYRINFIFAGDTHSYIEKQVGPTKFIITGCGGGSFHAPSTEVHFVEVYVDGNEIRTEKVFVLRDLRLVAISAYFLFVIVPRYRWYFFSGTILLLLWECLYAKWQGRKKANSH